MTCPPKDELSSLLAGDLDPGKMNEVRQHVEGCTQCQEHLDQIGNLGDLPVGPDASPQMSEYGPAFFRAIDSLRKTAGSGTLNLSRSALTRLLEPAADPRALGRLGHYEVFELIGQGGMGLVVRAHDNVLNRDVAIKILAPHMAHEATARERFAREARAAAAISHDNVLSIYSVSETVGLPYLVMPYITGRSLAEKLEREARLPMREVLRIGIQTAHGLAAAHAAGVVHRDIKPSNILLDGDQERVRIADFGLASVLDGSQLTQSGTIPGTPEFMAPEQALGQTIDARADLFSLGTVLYLMCTGQSPFRAATPLASLRRVCDDRPSSISELNPEVSAWFAAVVERLLEKSPADRYQTAAQVAQSLQQQLDSWEEPRRPEPRPNRIVDGGALLPNRQAIATPNESALAAAHGPLAKPHDPEHDRISFARGSRLWIAVGGLLLTALIASGLIWTNFKRVKQSASTALNSKTSSAKLETATSAEHPAEVSANTAATTKHSPKHHTAAKPKSAKSPALQSLSKAELPNEPAVSPNEQVVTLKVPGRSDPFLAGMPNGTKASGGDKAPAESPAMVKGIRIVEGEQLAFSAHGATKYDSRAHLNGPDGGVTFVSHSMSHQHGISNLKAPIDSLVGVFLGSDAPNVSDAPPALDFSSSGNVAGGIDYETFTPALKQIFFIGDGKNAAGVVQRVTVPPGATRLALATWDRSGWFNNSGSLEVTVSNSAAPADKPAADQPAADQPVATDAQPPANESTTTKSCAPQVSLLDIVERTR
jgi:serine/threonine protein kinase